jgi:hypothetical protein
MCEKNLTQDASYQNHPGFRTWRGARCPRVPRSCGYLRESRSILAHDPAVGGSSSKFVCWIRLPARQMTASHVLSSPPGPCGGCDCRRGEYPILTTLLLASRAPRSSEAWPSRALIAWRRPRRRPRLRFPNRSAAPRRSARPRHRWTSLILTAFFDDSTGPLIEHINKALHLCANGQTSLSPALRLLIGKTRWRACPGRPQS